MNPLQTRFQSQWKGWVQILSTTTAYYLTSLTGSDFRSWCDEQGLVLMDKQIQHLCDCPAMSFVKGVSWWTSVFMLYYCILLFYFCKSRAIMMLHIMLIVDTAFVMYFISGRNYYSSRNVEDWNLNCVQRFVLEVLCKEPLCAFPVR